MLKTPSGMDTSLAQAEEEKWLKFQQAQRGAFFVAKKVGRSRSAEVFSVHPPKNQTESIRIQLDIYIYIIM